MLPIRRYTKKPSGSQQSGKCAGKGRISFLQQIFPESLFISGQCKQKMNTKLQNWKILGVSMFLTFQHCQSETLPGMYQQSPSKSYVSKTKHFLLTCEKTTNQPTNILIWQLLTSVIFHSSQTAKRSNTLSYLSAKLTSLLTVPHILLTQRGFKKVIFIWEKNINFLFFLILEAMPNYSVCHIVLKCQLACNDWHWSFLR